MPHTAKIVEAVGEAYGFLAGTFFIGREDVI